MLKIHIDARMFCVRDTQENCLINFDKFYVESGYKNNNGIEFFLKKKSQRNFEKEFNILILHNNFMNLK